MKLPVRFSAWSIAKRGPRCLLSYVWLLCLLFGLGGAPANAANTTVQVGYGSTVPARLHSRLARAYNKRNPNIQMRYVPSGTGERNQADIT